MTAMVAPAYGRHLKDAARSGVTYERGTSRSGSGHALCVPLAIGAAQWNQGRSHVHTNDDEHTDRATLVEAMAGAGFRQTEG